MRYFYCRRICQALARHSKSTPQTQNNARRCLEISYAETHVPKPPIFSFKPANLTTSVQESNPPPAPTERVSAMVDELTQLTLIEIMELNDLLRQKSGIQDMPTMAVMMPGMKIGAAGGVKGGGRAAKAEEKAEKTAFDLKLDGGFDPAAKIKIIKEVRAFTSMGLKEAKELVEKAPSVFKKGVTKEEAQKIIKVMEGVGAKVTME